MGMYIEDIGLFLDKTMWAVFKNPLSFHQKLVDEDSPFLDYYNPKYIKGSIVQLIINQHGFWSHY